MEDEKKATVEGLLKEDLRALGSLCAASHCKLVGEIASFHITLYRVLRYDGRVPGRSLFINYWVTRGRFEGQEYLYEGSLRTEDPQEAVDTYNRWVEEYEVLRNELDG